MANLQVKNVPEELHEKLRRHARKEGTTTRELVLDALRREIARREFRARLARRAPVDLGRPASRSLEEARAEREHNGRPKR